MLKLLSEELILLAQKDQKLRLNTGKVLSCKRSTEKTDKKNTKRLEKIINKIGWPTVGKVGKEASYAAWLIAQHSDWDVAFQERCLRLILEEKNDVLQSNIAYLTDRVAVNRKKPQVYGTQFYKNTKGAMVPHPIRNAAGLSIRREKMGLEPFVVYKQKMTGKFRYAKDYKNPMIGRFYKAL